MKSWSELVKGLSDDICHRVMKFGEYELQGYVDL